MRYLFFLIRIKVPQAGNLASVFCVSDFVLLPSTDQNFVTTKRSFAIETKAIEKAASIYRAIHHPLRLKIIEIVHKAGRINVTPVIERLKLEQSLISAHLKILRDADIVTTKREGKSVFYSVNYQQVARISMLAEKLAPFPTDSSTFLQSVERKLVLKSKEGTIAFTPMELKIIRLVCQENTNEEMAQQLGLSRRTVEDHKSNIIKKMKVRNSVGILLFAVKKGLVKL